MKSLTRQSDVIPRPPVGLEDACAAALGDGNHAHAAGHGTGRAHDGANADEHRLLSLQIEADAAFAAANKGRTVALIEQIYDLLDVMEGKPVTSLPI